MSDISTGPGVTLIEQMFAAGRDLDAYVAFFTDDARYVFGNHPPVEGREAIKAALAHMRASGLRVTHDMKGLWEEGDVVVAEMDVTYARPEGQSVTLPCCDTFRLEGDKVSAMRVYVDMTPVMALMKPPA